MSFTSWLTGYATDQSMIASAKGGIPLTWSDAYADLAPWVKVAPTSLSDAYAQSIYLLALAARRADSDNNHSAQSFLLIALASMEAEQAGHSLPWSCSIVNVGCPVSRSDVLVRTREAIADSGVSPDDVARINELLTTHTRTLFLKKYGTLATGFILGGAFYYFGVYRK